MMRRRDSPTLFPVFQQEGDQEGPSKDGRLAGMTLFRFAHMSRNPTAGGVERYLSDLNLRLLQRNRMRIVQMHLVAEGSPLSITEEQIGRGQLTWIPSVLSESSPSLTTLERLLRKAWRRVGLQPFVRHDFLLSQLSQLSVTLAAFHWISEDSRVVLRSLGSRCTPYIVVNHFQNTRLTQPLIREQIAAAQAVCGVSGIAVPDFVASRFMNVSDGIDADFFNPLNARPLGRDIKKPLVLLPSRVTQGKGHLDAVRTLARLSREGVAATLALAGRVESDRFLRTVLEAVELEGLMGKVIVTGELSADELRSWYRASDIVLLTTHSEGLGRVLLEAQAMQKPVVAYDVGGVREAVAHGESGYLVSAGDVGALTERIKELLASSERRLQMGKYGRQRVVEGFSLDALADRHERLYEEAVLRSRILSEPIQGSA